MPFEAYLSQGFSHSHENRMFEQLSNALAASFGSESDQTYLLGNIMFDDKELDAVFLKHDAFYVIEMKDYGGLIHFSENTEWFADEIEVRGGVYGNPYRQTRANKFALLNFLQANATKILTQREIFQWWHICGIVLFGRDITFDERLPKTITDWLAICDFRNVVTALPSFHTRGRLLTAPELARIVGTLGFTQRHLYTGTAPTVPPAHSTSITGPQRLQVIYYNQSNFRAALLRLRQAGGRNTAAAMRLLNMIQQAGSGIDAFATLESSPDPRIEKSLHYILNEEAHLLAIRSDSTIHLCFCGIRGDNGWADNVFGINREGKAVVG